MLIIKDAVAVFAGFMLIIIDGVDDVAASR